MSSALVSFPHFNINIINPIFYCCSKTDYRFFSSLLILLTASDIFLLIRYDSCSVIFFDFVRALLCELLVVILSRSY